MSAEPPLGDPESAATLSELPCSSVLCRSRDLDLSDSIRIDSLKADADGWMGFGVVQMEYCVHGHCRTCNRVFEAARTQIPVVLPELACLTCDKPDYLRYKVQELTRTDDGYRFGVSIRCSYCSKVGTWSKMLTGLLKAVRIEVGLTGITVKAGGD